MIQIDIDSKNYNVLANNIKTKNNINKYNLN